jgi:hypothetical protein
MSETIDGDSRPLRIIRRRDPSSQVYYNNQNSPEETVKKFVCVTFARSLPNYSIRRGRRRSEIFGHNALRLFDLAASNPFLYLVSEVGLKLAGSL